VLAECGLPLAHLTRRTLERTRRQERREEDVEGQGGRGAGDVHAWLSNAHWEWPLRPFNASLPDPLAGPRQPRRRELQVPWPVWRRAGQVSQGQGGAAGAPGVPREGGRGGEGGPQGGRGHVAHAALLPPGSKGHQLHHQQLPQVCSLQS